MIIYLIIIVIILIAVILAIKANKSICEENKKLTSLQLDWKIAENNSVLSKYKICLAIFAGAFIITAMFISFISAIVLQNDFTHYQKHYKETLQAVNPVVVDYNKNYYISTNKDEVYFISEAGLEQKNFEFCQIIESTETKIEVYDLEAKLTTEKLLWNMFFFADLYKEFYVIYTPDVYKYPKNTNFIEVQSIAQKAMLFIQPTTTT